MELDERGTTWCNSTGPNAILGLLGNRPETTSGPMTGSISGPQK